MPEYDDLQKWWDSGERKDAHPGLTAVVTFPEGLNPAGLWDGAGNVWEWTGSWNGELCVLRGGSWSDNRRDARCASRFDLNPGTFFDSAGFRVIFPGSLPSGS